MYVCIYALFPYVTNYRLSLDKFDAIRDEQPSSLQPILVNKTQKLF